MLKTRGAIGAAGDVNIGYVDLGGGVTYSFACGGELSIDSLISENQAKKGQELSHIETST